MPLISLRDIFIIDALGAIVTSLWFRKQEPRSYRLMLTVLAAAPAPIAILLLSGYSYSWTSVFLAYSLFMVSLLASTGAYRISPFHPLAKYPGPVLCKLSKLWAAWIAHRGKAHAYYQKLHRKYGPIIRIGPNEISIIEADLIPFILGTHGMPKGPLWDGRLIASSEQARLYNLIACRDLHRHAQLRKPWNKSFSFDPMKGYEEILLSRGTQLTDTLDHICKTNLDRIGNVDMAKWISCFSFDFMGDIAFGGGFEFMRDGDKDKVWHSMERATLLPNITMHIPWIVPAIQTLPFLVADTVQFAHFCVKQAYRRKATTNLKQKDLFYYLTTSMDEDSEEASFFPIVASNAVLTVVAGSDTTASVLCNVLYYLLSHPDYYTRLQGELDQEFSPTSVAPIDTDKLSEQQLLNAIINETLRLQPAVPTALQRAPAKSSSGKAIGSMFIPEGTAVLVPPYVLHRDHRYFSPYPEKFWPERWIKKDPSIILDRSAFIPFSHGPAICAGKALAMLELRMIVAMLVQKFDMSFSDGYDYALWEEDLMDRLVFSKGALPVKLTIRKF